jgi:transglutaminase-like putative cysteine protease
MSEGKDDIGGRRFGAVGIVICSFVAIFLLASGIPALSVPVDYLNFNDTDATIGSGPNPGDPVVDASGDGSSQPRIGGDPDGSEGAQSAGTEERFADPPPNRTSAEAVHFIVRAEAPAYWRLTAYDTYLQDGWRRSGRPPAWEPDPSSTSRTLLSQEVTLRIPAVVLPAAWRPVGVSSASEADPAFGAETGVVLNGTAAPNETFVVTSLRPETDPAVLDAAGDDYPNGLEERYTALPESVPDRVFSRTDDVTADADTPYETALAVEQWLRSNYEFRMNRSAVTNDTAAEVLFEREAAHSSTLATTMTVMLRAEGVPARYVKGYTPGVPNGTNDTYVVRSVHQHSWVEVYFPETGWVPFDPTPGGDRRALVGERTDTESGMRYLDHGNRSFGVGGNEEGAPAGSEQRENGSEAGDGAGEGAGDEGAENGSSAATNESDGTQSEGGSPRSGGDEQNDDVENNRTDDDREAGTEDSGNTDGDDGTDGDDSSGAGDQNRSQDGSRGGETPEEGGTDGSRNEGDSGRNESGDSSQSESGERDGGQSGSESSGGGGGSAESDSSGGTDGGSSSSGSSSSGEGSSSGAPGPQNREFGLELVDEPVPGQPLRVRVVSKNEPVPGARIRFDGEPVGETNESGVVAGTVPFRESLNVTAYAGGERTTGQDAPEQIATRSVALPTTIDVSLEDDPYAGTDVALNATIEGYPVPDGDVSVADRLAARTNRSGLATVRLPETTGNVTLAVERGAASGERTVELPPVTIATAARPAPLPGRPTTVTVEHDDGTPVADAAVLLGGERVASTDDRGTATISPGLSYESTVAATGGDWRVATSISPLRNLLAGVGALVVVSLLAGAVAKALGRTPLGFVRSAPAAVASKLLVALILLTRLVDLVWSTVVRAVSPTSASRLLSALDAGMVRERIAAVRAALAAAVAGVFGSSTGAAESASRAPTRHAGDGAVRRAWGLLLGAVAVTRPVTSTPREIANRAIAAGMPADAVETILETFRTVEYGDRDPDQSRLAAVRDAAESVRSDDG